MTSEVTLVIEWDNVTLSGASRAQSMLESLRREIRACPKSVEFLLVHDAARPAPDTDALNLGPSRRLEVAPGSRYYDLKNQGAQQAHGEIVVFVDSDVIPEPGWLKNLLIPFDDPGVQCVAGSAYIDPRDTYSRAFALFWFFPLRPEGDTLVPACNFWANNVAFRRETILAHPFPAIKGSSRGSCILLAEQLGAAGITIWSNSAARVSHPAPQRGAHFVRRALAQGRDRILRAKGWQSSPLAPMAIFARNLARGSGRILLYHRRVGLTIAMLPAACVVCLAYYGLMLIGELGAMLRIPAVRRIEV